MSDKKVNDVVDAIVSNVALAGIPTLAKGWELLVDTLTGNKPKAEDVVKTVVGLATDLDLDGADGAVDGPAEASDESGASKS